jgi:hypothetical protein
MLIEVDRGHIEDFLRFCSHDSTPLMNGDVVHTQYAALDPPRPRPGPEGDGACQSEFTAKRCRSVASAWGLFEYGGPPDHPPCHRRWNDPGRRLGSIRSMRSWAGHRLGIKVAWANEAFELWCMLHFDYLETGLSRNLG